VAVDVGGMEFTVYENPNEFARKAEPYLKEKEDVFSLFLGVLQGIKAGHYENPFMATIEEDGELLALFQMTPPYPFNMVIINENRLEESLSRVIDEIVSRKVSITSVISLKPWAYRFAEKWKEATGETYELEIDQGLYRLDEVDETLEKSSGAWRYAESSDRPLIERWYHLFSEDAGLPPSPDDYIKGQVEMFVRNKEVFLWEDEGKIVSMMKKARPTDYGVTVSFVFTPREERKKGYARTMVAAGSKELLKEFDFCVLYTNMLNPTSNKIYQEIGYKRIADSVQLKFVKA